MDAEEKKSVRVTVYNQTFTLRVAGDPDRLLHAAAEVDELMTAIARTGNMDTTRVAILACLHLQDKLRTMEDDLARLRAIEERTRELASLLDNVVDQNSLS